MAKAKILVVDDDRIILDSLCEFIQVEGYHATAAASFTEAVAKLQNQRFAIVITDINMPDGNGFELLSLIKKDYPQTVVVVITGYGTIESAVEAIKMGAYDYLTKPVIDDDLLLAIERAVRQQSLISENLQLRLQLKEKYSLSNVISHDYKMAKIFDLIEAVADTNTTILMTGPSGTGKSMIARAVHYQSSRKNAPFVEVSCGALPETLLESELFGHVKGAFTGAVSDKKGKFLAADGGTIFLDEISNASPAMQVKLLRVLQNRQFEAVGSNKTITIDTRVILASNSNLAEEVKAGRFREDLYYRINVITVNLPLLIDRVGDIPLLADHFLQHFCRIHNKKKLGINESGMQCLQHYDWPGNVRELENVIERAVLLSKQQCIDIEDMPQNLITQSQDNDQKECNNMSLKEALGKPEKNIIRNALEACHWNRQETAKMLNINRTTLYKKMKRFDLEDEAARLGL